jgi:hypothetical protein
MKKNLAVLAILAMSVLCAHKARSAAVFTGLLVNEPALTHSANYVLDLNASDINRLSAQAVYSSATIPSATFQDGAQSTGSFTVVTNTALTAARAVDHITIVSTTGLSGAAIATPGFVFREGFNWKVQATPVLTAASLAAAMGAMTNVSVSASFNVVYATAVSPGSAGNLISLVSSTPTALTVATLNFTGGRDAASVGIDGTTLRQGVDWSTGATAALTAANIAASINASPLSGFLAAQAVGAVVTATSTLTGANKNFVLSSSTAAIIKSGAAMTGGQNSAYAINSALISLPAHGFSSGLPVLFSKDSSPAIGGLTDQTTYYAIPVGINSLELASSQANAIAAVPIPIVLTSSSTQTSPHTYTLTPLAISGTPGLDWQGSNDGINWVETGLSSVTITSYINPAATTAWDFGTFNLRFLRAKIAGPTTGGLALTVQINGKN